MRATSHSVARIVAITVIALIALAASRIRGCSAARPPAPPALDLDPTRGDPDRLARTRIEAGRDLPPPRPARSSTPNGSAVPQRQTLEARTGSTGPDAAQLVARALAQEALRCRLKLRWNLNLGTPQRIDLTPPAAVVGETPQEVAQALLKTLGPLLQIDLDQEALAFLGASRLGQGFWVARFEQRVRGVPVFDTELRVFMRRKRGHPTRVHAVLARVVRDLPAGALMGEPPLPKASGPPVKIGPLTLVGSRSDTVVARDLHGRWQYTRRAVVVEQGSPLLILTGLDGGEITRRPLAAFGEASGSVQPTEELKLYHRKISYLEVFTPSGTVVTDSEGRFPGTSASLPRGFAGPFAVVVPEAKRYPSAHDGDLRLIFNGSDPRVQELSVFYHLSKIRDWLAGHRGLIGKASDVRNAVVVRAPGTRSFAMDEETQVDGQRLPMAMVLGGWEGRSDALSPSIVAHERMHLLMNALGFDSRLRAGLHEGLADYLSAAYTGNPVIGARALGVPRDLRKVRTWPEDAKGSAHNTGWILAGALWDARREAGEAIDRIVLAGIPLLSEGGDDKGLRASLDTFLAADQRLYGGRNSALLRKHFARHGIGVLEGRAPTLSLSSQGRGRVTGTVQQRIKLTVGEERVILVIARDPDGTPVELGISHPPFAESEDMDPREGGTSRQLTFRPAEAGTHELVLTAQDAAGETTVRRLQIAVLDREGEDFDEKHVVELDLEPGGTRLLQIPYLLPIQARKEYAGVMWRLTGSASLNAQAGGGQLYLKADPGDEGLHELLISGARSNEGAETVQLIAKVTVGSGPRIDVFRRQDDFGGYRANRVPPSAPLVVEAGSSLELMLTAPEGSQGATFSAQAAGKIATECEKARGPWRGVPEASCYAMLNVTAPPEASPGSVSLNVVLSGTNGNGLVSRRLPLVIVPRSPPVEIEGRRSGGVVSPKSTGITGQLGREHRAEPGGRR